MVNADLFWSGITKENGDTLTMLEKIQFCKELIQFLSATPEFAKIHFNTQVYNNLDRGVTTRGEHSVGVSIVAAKLAEQFSSQILHEGNLSACIAGFLAKALGYMHDLGHTPYGHDGEGAIDNEMERFKTTQEYMDVRRKVYGEEYEEQVQSDGNMGYEHNEMGSSIGASLVKKFCMQNGYRIEESSLSYLKMGILAHSISRVQSEPKGVEQRAVRLADKIAYIPQDLLDLVKQGILSIDELSNDELKLIGLNDSLSETEKVIYSVIRDPEARKEYEEKCIKKRKALRDRIRKMDSLTKEKRRELFQELDERVHHVQGEIAQKCLQEREGEKCLESGSEEISFYVKASKGQLPKDRELTETEKKGIELFKRMLEEQKIPMTHEDREERVDKASVELLTFFQENYHIDPLLCILWVTKAKYQDALIKGHLLQLDNEESETPIEKSLGNMNCRNANRWKIKTVFQFFYTHPNLIPEEYREKMHEMGFEGNMPEQLTAYFVASFSNKSLNILYERLVASRLVISRDQAIREVQKKLPKIDIEAVVSEGRMWHDPQDFTQSYEIMANDVLEYLFETYVGEPIVSGKEIGKERIIPAIQHADAIEQGILAFPKPSVIKKTKKKSGTYSLVDELFPDVIVSKVVSPETVEFAIRNAEDIKKRRD